MDPGEFDKRISLMISTEIGRDAAGSPIMGLTELARPWAKVVQQGGREFIAGDGEQTEKRVVFRVYSGLAFDTSAIVRFNAVDHDIKDIRPFDDVTEIHTVVPKVSA